MNLTELFIRRPVMTVLLNLSLLAALALAALFKRDEQGWLRPALGSRS